MRRISSAHLIALVALSVSLGGTSYAAISVSGKNIRDNSVTNKDIKNRSLLAKDFKRGQLKASAPGRPGPAGPQGATGPKGPAGSPGTSGGPGKETLAGSDGARAFGTVDGTSGEITRGGKGLTSRSTGKGVYCIEPTADTGIDLKIVRPAFTVVDTRNAIVRLAGVGGDLCPGWTVTTAVFTGNPLQLTGDDASFSVLVP